MSGRGGYRGQGRGRGYQGRGGWRGGGGGRGYYRSRQRYNNRAGWNDTGDARNKQTQSEAAKN